MADAKPDEKKDAVTGDTGTPPDKGEAKVHTNAETEAIVKDRLERFRKTHGVEVQTAEEKAVATEAKLEEANKTIETLKQTSATVEEVDGILKEVHTGLLEGIPEEKQTLIPESLSLAEQVKFINKNKAHLFDVESLVKKPKTPESDRFSPEGKASDIPGGYATWKEFAEKDPRGYVKLRKSQGADLR